MHSNTINSVGPLFDMPAQTWTFTGSLGFPFNFGCSNLQWKLSLLWFSSRTEYSSVNISLSNCSFSRRHFSLNSSRLTLLDSRISWQYLVPVCTQPSFRWRRLTFSCENWNPKCRRILLVSSGEVNSSFLSISVSIKFISSIVTPWDGRPDLGAFSSDCLSWYRLKNLMMLQRLILISSSARILTISDAPFPFDRSLMILTFWSCVRKPMVACTCNWCNSEKRQEKSRNWNALLRLAKTRKHLHNKGNHFLQLRGGDLDPLITDANLN